MSDCIQFVPKLLHPAFGGISGQIRWQSNAQTSGICVWQRIVGRLLQRLVDRLVDRLLGR